MKSLLRLSFDKLFIIATIFIQQSSANSYNCINNHCVRYLTSLSPNLDRSSFTSYARSDDRVPKHSSSWQGIGKYPYPFLQAQQTSRIRQLSLKRDQIIVRQLYPSVHKNQLPYPKEYMTQNKDQQNQLSYHKPEVLYDIITERQDEEEPFEIAKPLVADLVQGMGVTTGNTAFTYKLVTPLNGDPFILAIDSEGCFRDGGAIGGGLEYLGYDLQQIKAANQLTLNKDRNKTEGTLSNLSFHVQQASIETFKNYVRTDKLNSVFSNMFFAGVRIEARINELLRGGFMLHNTLFMTVSKRLTLGMELNVFYDVVSSGLSVMVHPQLHIKFGEMLTVQVGFGVMVAGGQVVPQFVHRVVVHNKVT